MNPDEGSDAPPAARVNPLLRLHLLLYGRYKWALLLGFLLAACGGAAAWKLTPPKYEVVGGLRVKPYIPPVLSTTDQNGVIPMFESFVSLQVSLLQSQRVLDQASLNPDWKALGRNVPRWGAKIPADALTVGHASGSEIVTVGFSDPNLTVAAIAVKSVLQAYQATSGDTDGASDSHRLQVLEDLRTSLTNQKRGLSDQILALANEFGSDDLQERYHFKMEGQNRLESELQQVALEISMAQAATGAGTEPAPPPSIPPTPPHPPATSAPGDPLKASATQTAPSAPAKAPSIQPVVLTREDVAKVDLQMRNDLAERSRLTFRLDQLRSHLGDNHPEVVAIGREIQAMENQINSLLATYQKRDSDGGNAISAAGLAGSRLSLAELRARDANLRTLLASVQVETKALGQQDLKIRKLKDDRETVSHKLAETAARIDQLNLEATTANRISVLSYGESPTAPLPSKRTPYAVVMSMLGLAIGVGLVALRGLLDQRVSSLRHMQHLAPTLRVLGMLPVLPDDLADPGQISFAAHCVHQIRNLLETLPAHDHGRVLAITSPAAGDGKTSLSLALGLSFAASGSRTLLIDCDLVGGGLTRRLNAIAHRRIGGILRREGLLTEDQVEAALRLAATSNKKIGEALVTLGYLQGQDLQRALAHQPQTSVGLMDALAGEPLSACVTSAVREGLFILPVGDAAPVNTSQISAKALRRVIQEASRQFDFIIIDTGPILGSLEASVAACEADEVILAVARGAPSPLVTRTVEMLASLGAHLGGVVFNRATPGDVLHSHYGSSGSLLSLRASDAPPRSPSEPRRPAGAPVRLGPLAGAVVTAGHSAAPTKTTVSSANGSAKKPAGNGSPPAASPTSSVNGAAQESTNP